MTSPPRSVSDSDAVLGTSPSGVLFQPDGLQPPMQAFQGQGLNGRKTTWKKPEQETDMPAQDTVANVFTEQEEPFLQPVTNGTYGQANGRSDSVVSQVSMAQANMWSRKKGCCCAITNLVLGIVLGVTGMYFFLTNPCPDQDNS